VKSLVLGSSILVGAATGCTTTVAAHIDAHWSFEDLATRTMTQCPTGFDVAAVYAQELDANLNTFGQAYIDLYPCTDLAGTSLALPASWFETWVEITNGTGGLVYAQSAGVLVDIVRTDATVDLPTILNDGGYFQLKWELVTASAPTMSLTCSKSGAAGGILATSTDVQTNAMFPDGFYCENGVSVDTGAGEGFTEGLLAGPYTVSVQALDAANAPIGTAATITQSVATQNGITNLGTVLIPINGT
jgi:hypothetical protein